MKILGIGNAIVDVIDVILNNNVDYIHVSQSRRSNKTFQLILDKAENLANRLGYLELFGWMSSLVIKKNYFINALKNTQNQLKINHGKILFPR